MQGGKLKLEIDLQRKTVTRNEYKEEEPTWETYAEAIRAQLISGAGAERLVGQQVTGRGSVVWRIRYTSPEPQITDRVKYGDRLFDINDSSNTEEKNFELLLTCTEVTG